MADKAPVPVAMAVANVESENPLMGMKGTLIRQDAELAECVLQKLLNCRCCEFANIYRLAGMPADKNTLTNKTDENGWTPSMDEMTNLPKTIIGREKSDALTRCFLSCCGCGQFRPFVMDFTPAESESVSYFRMDRPFSLGGICCCPHTADTFVGGNKVGRVKEDWTCGNYFPRCFEAIFCCRVPYNLEIIRNGEFVTRYKVLFNFCCSGPHFNCLGSTCIFNDMLFDVVIPKPDGSQSPPVGHIQKTYGGMFSPEALLRCCCFQADNFIVQWPEEATVEERALLLTATTLVEYLFFEIK